LKEDLAAWIVGALVVAVAYLGLLMAANAHDAIFYWVGLLFFTFAVLFGFDLIRRAVGRAGDGAA